jgi:hypothetical protein
MASLFRVNIAISGYPHATNRVVITNMLGLLT